MGKRQDQLRRALVTGLSLTSLSFTTAAVASAHSPHAAAPPPSVTATPTGVAALSRSALAADRRAVVVALGDSVPAGSGCACRNFVSSYGDLLSRRAPHAAGVTNLAQGGAQTADVLEQLRLPAVRQALSDATTVLLMIGANDFYGPFRRVQGGASAATEYRAAAQRVRINLARTISQIRSLQAGPVKIVVVGYWNVVEDGRVGRRDYGPAGVASAESATRWANHALRDAARSGHVMYVSTYKAFKGAEGRKDPTRLLTADGDHPNAAGHRLLARTVYAPVPTG